MSAQLTTKVAGSIADALKKVGEPLTDTQLIVIAGSLAVWLEKAYQDGYRRNTLDRELDQYIDT